MALNIYQSNMYLFIIIIYFDLGIVYISGLSTVDTPLTFYPGTY